MIKRSSSISLALSASLMATTLIACSQPSDNNVNAKPDSVDDTAIVTKQQGKPVVYQMFTRLFGNKNTTNKHWGTLEENGVGKFSDIDDTALAAITELGVTHLWYTGVPHHAVIGDYQEFGIGLDDPDVVKGRAGSPYAVKDYYNVNPDLADNPANRLAEFEALIARTHQHGMKVVIDIVPNHVARNYQSLSNPEGVSDFGAQDDTSVEYARDNNFYYVVGQPFIVPNGNDGYRPLNGESHPLSDGTFDENPAKWTGNGSRKAQPDINDWYETVKVNYGVKPDGSYDFDKLPADFAQKNVKAHAEFWQNKDVPDSWIKFRDITHYWLAKGVDGFRYDMAEMVPVEFWSYLNSSIKSVNPDAFLLAEVYTPSLYRDYIHLGKMDYLYDKVEMYDTLKLIMQDKASTDALVPLQAGMHDIEHHMLHFLENHDEQRIASPDFAGDAHKAKPAMVVSATISTSPTMLYFGQDVGEAAAVDAGFGTKTRTTIFDYWGVDAHQRWMNNGAFDGGLLTDSEQSLRDFYVRLMQFSATSNVLNGEYVELHSHNRLANTRYDERMFSFARWNDDQKLIAISNFDADETKQIVFTLPTDLIKLWRLEDGKYQMSDALYAGEHTLTVNEQRGEITLSLSPLESVLLTF